MIGALFGVALLAGGDPFAVRQLKDPSEDDPLFCSECVDCCVDWDDGGAGDRRRQIIEDVRVRLIGQSPDLRALVPTVHRLFDETPTDPAVRNLVWELAGLESGEAREREFASLEPMSASERVLVEIARASDSDSDAAHTDHLARALDAIAEESREGTSHLESREAAYAELAVELERDREWAAEPLDLSGSWCGICAMEIAGEHAAAGRRARFNVGQVDLHDAMDQGPNDDHDLLYPRPSVWARAREPGSSVVWEVVFDYSRTRVSSDLSERGAANFTIARDVVEGYADASPSEVIDAIERSDADESLRVLAAGFLKKLAEPAREELRDRSASGDDVAADLARRAGFSR